MASKRAAIRNRVGIGLYPIRIYLSWLPQLDPVPHRVPPKCLAYIEPRALRSQPLQTKIDATTSSAVTNSCFTFFPNVWMLMNSMIRALQNSGHLLFAIGCNESLGQLGRNYAHTTLLVEHGFLTAEFGFNRVILGKENSDVA